MNGPVNLTACVNTFPFEVKVRDKEEIIRLHDELCSQFRALVPVYNESYFGERRALKDTLGDIQNRITILKWVLNLDFPLDKNTNNPIIPPVCEKL